MKGDHSFSSAGQRDLGSRGAVLPPNKRMQFVVSIIAAERKLVLRHARKSLAATDATGARL
jgi:hypothetical protein